MKCCKPILLVEDDIIDSMTVKRALKDIKVKNPLIVKKNGEEALDYLCNSRDGLPCLILLDINMPKMNGIEFLESFRKEEEINFIPVVILTSSSEECDRISSYKLGISGYMIKPVGYAQFVEVIRTIDMYWTLCETPN